MSAYELSDELVQRVISGHTSAANQDLLFEELERQLPKPVPIRLAAVIRTSDGDYIAVAPTPTDDGENSYRWTEVGVPEPRWFEDANLPKITAVLSEGVDL